MNILQNKALLGTVIAIAMPMLSAFGIQLTTDQATVIMTAAGIVVGLIGTYVHGLYTPVPGSISNASTAATATPAASSSPAIPPVASILLLCGMLALGGSLGGCSTTQMSVANKTIATDAQAVAKGFSSASDAVTQMSNSITAVSNLQSTGSTDIDTINNFKSWANVAADALSIVLPFIL